MTNVVNDQCGSQDKDQPTNLSINNPSFNEISTNENRSLLNNTQVPDSHDNQRVTIDLTTKPKEGVNIIYNPQPDNENNLGINRHPRASTTPPVHSLGAEGGAQKETDVISNIRMKNRNIWCPVLSYKSDATALRALGAIFLIAPLFLIAYSQ